MRTSTCLLALLLLAGCGGGGDAGPTRTTPTAVVPGGPQGTPAPEALSGFGCVEDDGAWRAAGALANPGKNAVTYQVTVFVGEATGGEEQAATRQVTVAAGGSARFELEDVPAPDDGGTCHVQVLVVR